MKPDLFIRADGSTKIGLGHLVRCISLACILKKRFKIVFVCRAIPDSTKKELNTHGFELLEIIDEQAFFDSLNDGVITVLDGYQFSPNYQKEIKNHGSLLVCIDDIHDRKFYADIIINHAPGVIEDDYKALPDTKFALGPDYALLRPLFLEHAKKVNRIPGDTETILICFGGSDVKNLTNLTLEVIKGFTRFKKIILITGPAYKYDLQATVIKGRQIEHYHAVGEKQMLRLMCESGNVVVPASGILFEALTVGNKIVSGFYNDNQKDAYSGFKKLGAFIDAKSFKKEDLIEALQKVDNYQRADVIDGKSPQRLLSLFKKLSQKNRN